MTTRPGYTTFMVRTNTLQALRRIAHAERRTMVAVLDLALDRYIKASPEFRSLNAKYGTTATKEGAANPQETAGNGQSSVVSIRPGRQGRKAAHGTTNATVKQSIFEILNSGPVPENIDDAIQFINQKTAEILAQKPKK